MAISKQKERSNRSEFAIGLFERNAREPLWGHNFRSNLCDWEINFPPFLERHRVEDEHSLYYIVMLQRGGGGKMRIGTIDL